MNKHENNWNNSQVNEPPEVDIHESMAALISFMDNLKANISIFRHDFRQAYLSYIRKITAPTTDPRKRMKVNYKIHSKLTKIYEYVMKVLDDFMTDFAKEYADTLSMAINLSSYKESYNDIMNRYPDFDDLDTDHLYRLEKKVEKIISKYNKLALSYNARIRHFEALKGNILNGTLVYTTEKLERFAVSISDQLALFQQTIETDAVTNQRRPVSTRSVPQFDRKMKSVAGKTKLVEISTLGGSKKRVRFQALDAEPRSEESEGNESNGSGAERQRSTKKRGSKRNPYFDKDRKSSKQRKDEVQNLSEAIENDEECDEKQCDEKVDTFINSVLTHDIDKLMNYVNVLSQDGVSEALKTFEEILEGLDSKHSPTKVYGRPDPDDDSDANDDSEPIPINKRGRKDTEYSLIDQYEHRRVKNDAKTKMLNEERSDIVALGQSAYLLYLIDKRNNAYDSCLQLKLAKLGNALLDKFDEVKVQLPSVIEEININDNAPAGKVRNFHNLSSKGKKLLMKQELIERQLKNANKLCDMAIDKTENRYQLETTDGLQMILERVDEFVKVCHGIIDGKIEDLERELKKMEDQIELKEMEQALEKERKKKGNDDADSFASDGTYINPTREPKGQIRSLRTRAKLPSDEKFDPDLLKKIVQELKIKIINIARDEVKVRNPGGKNYRDRSKDECTNIVIMNQNLDQEFQEFLKNSTDQIKTADIYNYEEVIKIQTEVARIERSKEIVTSKTLQPLTAIVEKAMEVGDKTAEQQIQYLSLALVLIYLQVQYYDYQRQKEIGGNNVDTTVDKLTVNIRLARECFNKVAAKLEKLTPT